MKDILIEFMDSIRGYVRESDTNIAFDERDSIEFVEIFLKDYFDNIQEFNLSLTYISGHKVKLHNRLYKLHLPENKNEITTSVTGISPHSFLGTCWREIEV